MSAKGRDEISEVNPLMNYIQTDVAINPGNSGGPLISINGEVIGVNTMIYSRSGGSIGIGFSIPINMAKDIAEQLKSKGRIERGWLGVEVNEFDEDLRKTLGFKGGGLYIVRVFKDSPAEKSGLEAGDIILKLGDKTVNTLKTLKVLVSSSPGETFDLKVKRGKKEITLKVKIGEDTSQIRSTPNGSEINLLGITVVDMDDNLMNKYRTRRPFGVVISKIERGSAFEGTGIRVGDIIRMVESTPTPTLNVFNQIIQENSKNKEILFHIYRNGRLTPVRVYP